MIPRDILYGLPEIAFLAFVAIPILWLFWRLFQYRNQTLTRIADKAILAEIMIPRSKAIFWMKTVAACLAWILATLALMQPKGNAHYSSEKSIQTSTVSKKIKRKAHDVILLIDASASMSVEDSRNGKSRLEYAKEVADEIIAELVGESVSLYAFTSEPAEMAPLTMDYVFLRFMLRQMHINEGDVSGTNIAEALAMMRKSFFSTHSSKLTTLILLSDGGDTQLEGMQGEERKRVIASISNLVAETDPLDLRVFTIGFGGKEFKEIPGITYQGKVVLSAIVEDLLQEIAKKGRGSYFFANDYSAFNIAKMVSKEMMRSGLFLDSEEDLKEPSHASQEDLLYDLYYQFPLGFAIVCLLYMITGPDSKKLKKHASFLLTMLLFPSFVSGVESTFLEAKNFYEIKQYGRTKKILDNLLEQPLKPWEKAIVTYDVGTVLLAKGDWEGAIHQFNAVPKEADDMPLLLSRLKANLAIAYLRQFLSLSSASYMTSMTILTESLKSIQQAEKAVCALAAIEGYPQCPKEYRLIELHLAVKQQLAAEYQRHEAYEIFKLPLEESLFLLFTSINTGILHLNFLEKISLKSSLRQKYQDLFVSEGNSWLPLWGRQSRRANKESEIFPIFEKAEVSYRKAMEKMKEGDIENGKILFSIAQDSLNELLRFIYHHDAVEILIKKLLYTYRSVLEQSPIQEASLLGLQNEQQQVGQMIHSGGGHVEDSRKKESIKLKIDSSLERLAYSLKFFQMGSLNAARLFLMDAHYQMEYLLESLGKEKEILPKNILQSMIKNQQHAISLNEDVLWRIPREEANREFDVLLLQAQNKAMKSSAPFLEEVFKQQTAQFNSNQTHRCQKHPWDEVLPLHDQGYQAAMKAKALLEGEQPNKELALKEQKDALNYWKEALEKLDQPISELKKLPQALNVENILRQLEEMNQADQQPQPEKKQVKEGTKPW